MAARIQSSAIDIKIERLVKADAGPVSAFTCGCDELDYFFHNEMFECVNNHYLSAYCAKSMNNDLLAIFTLANDSIVLTDYEAKDDFILEAGCRINDTYLDRHSLNSSGYEISLPSGETWVAYRVGDERIKRGAQQLRTTRQLMNAECRHKSHHHLYENELELVRRNQHT